MNGVVKNDIHWDQDKADYKIAGLKTRLVIQYNNSTGSAKYHFLKMLKKNYWIFSQISIFIWKYNSSG